LPGTHFPTLPTSFALDIENPHFCTLPHSVEGLVRPVLALREFLKDSYPFPMFSPNSGKSITADNFLSDVRQYLVENGPLGMRGYREGEFKLLEEAGQGGIGMFADLSQISRCRRNM
jgi:hypothetical protein